MKDYLEQSFELEDPAIASIVDELSFWSARFGKLLYDNLELRANLAVLDLGCGTGFPLFELAHTFGETCRFVGADIWIEGLKRADRKLRTFRLANVSLVRADGVKLPFRDASFDLVVSNLGVNNFENSSAAFRECGRVIKRGGRLALTTNPKGHMREFYEHYRAVLAELGMSSDLKTLDAQESHRATLSELERLLRRAGFELERVVEDEFVLRYLDARALFAHSLVWLGFLDGWKSVVDPSERETVFTALEERLDGEALRAGELRMTVPMLYLQGVKG